MYDRSRLPARKDADKVGNVLVYFDTLGRWVTYNWFNLQTRRDWSHWQSLPPNPNERLTNDHLPL